MWCKKCKQICEDGPNFKCSCGCYQSAHQANPPDDYVPPNDVSSPALTAKTSSHTSPDIMVPQIEEEDEFTEIKPESPKKAQLKMKRKKGKETYARPTEGKILYSSYLKKKHKKNNLKWQRRFFVLYKESILYYDNEFEKDTDEAKGKLDLDTFIKVKFFLSIVGDYMISIELAEKTIDLQAEQKKYWNTWFNAFTKMLGPDKTEKSEVLPSASKQRYARPKEEKELYSGLLKKRHKKNHKLWQERFFVLYEGALLYYANESERDDDIAKGRITKNDILKACFGMEDNKFLSLECAGGKIVLLQATSRNEMLRWHEPFVAMLGADKVEKSDEEKVSYPKDIVYSGYLKKRSPKSRYVWQERYYVLTKTELEYYEDDTYKSKKGEILLKDIKTSILHGEENRSINIVLAEKTHELMAATSIDASRWIDHFEKLLNDDQIERVVSSSINTRETVVQMGPVDAASTLVIKSGILKKRSPKNKLVWQARFFTLHKDSLLYYENESERQNNKNAIKGEIKCADIKNVTLRGENAKMLDLDIGTKIVELIAPTPRDAEKWFAKFDQVLGPERTTRALLNRGNKLQANIEAPKTPHSPSIVPVKPDVKSEQKYPSDVDESLCDFNYVTKSGNLKKETPKTMLGMSTFQKRFFALEERGKKSRLCYWKNEKDKAKAMIGSISLTSIINIQPFTDSAGSNFLMIHMNGVRQRIFVLQCPKKEVMKEWLEAIQPAIGKAHQRQN